jgi:hypothetical protein
MSPDCKRKVYKSSEARKAFTNDFSFHIGMVVMNNAIRAKQYFAINLPLQVDRQLHVHL